MFPFDSALHIIGLILAFVIGLSLGLLGSGGSAITVPVLVYCMGISVTQSISESVFVVGITSFCGGIYNLIQNRVAWSPLLWLGIPSVISAFITKWFIVPTLPAEISIFQIQMSKDSYLMLLFAVLLLLISRGMIRPKKIASVENSTTKFFPAVITGLVVGCLIGLLGIGGGFLIVPVLVLYFHLDMKIAVGTSLWLIAFNCLVSIVSDSSGSVFDWNFLFLYTGLTILGMVISWSLSKRISSEKIKVIAGYVILLTGIFVIAERIFGNH